MADNVSLTTGDGTGGTVAADEVSDGTLGTVKVQYVKIMDGTIDGTGKAAVTSGGLKVDLGADNDVTVTGNITTVTAVTSITNPVAVTDNSGSLTVDNNGTFVVQENGAALTALQVIDDWDETDRCKVNLIVGQAGIAAGAGAVGATVPRVTLASDDGAVVALQIMDDWDNAASDGASVSGDVAHDTADAGEPVKVGGKAVSALSDVTLVTGNDRTNAHADLDGAMIVRGNYALGDLVNGNASNTDGTSTQVLAAGAAGIKHYITDVTITNMSATNIFVELKDGATTKWTFPVPATSGVVKSFQSPIAGTAATAWNFDPSSAATTVYCSVSGFKSKI